MEIIRRTFQPRSRMTPRVPARSSPSTVNWLQPATPWPRATASFTASHDGSSRRRLYLAYGVRGDGELPRIDGTHYFYRDGSELAEERETFEELTQR